jgi:hypothetical protein
MADSTLTTRNASLAELASLLEDQHTRKLDVVTAATKLTAVGGNLVLAGAGEPLLTPEGVTATDVALRPTSSADANLADKLGIPIKYIVRSVSQGTQPMAADPTSVPYLRPFLSVATCAAPRGAGVQALLEHNQVHGRPADASAVDLARRDTRSALAAW